MFKGYTGEVQVGEGGLGRVYRATKISTGGFVAIKELSVVAQGSPAWHRARREVDALLRLKGHPHVISVEEMIEGPNGPCIVMEFASGGSLMDRLAAGPLPFAELVLVGQHVTLALGAAHEVGIVHRDVKPHNLLVATFGQVKVCDFGIAAVARGDDGRTQTQSLTLAYASPEELDGDLVVGPPADVYSFAATLQHLATGRKPSFQDRMSGETREALWPDSGRLFMKPVFDAMKEAMAHRPDARPTMDELGVVFDAASLALGALRLRRLPQRALPQLDNDATVVRRVPATSQEEMPGAFADPSVVEGNSHRLHRESAPAPRLAVDARLDPTVIRRGLPQAPKRKVATTAAEAVAPTLIPSSDEVFSASFSPSGRHIVTADTGETAVIWDVTTGARLAELVGHRGSVFAASFSPDGLVVATAGEDGRVIFWEVSTCRQLAELAAHSRGAYSVAFSPDGLSVVSDGADGEVLLWDVATASRLNTFPGYFGDVYGAAFSPDGRAIVTITEGGSAIVSDLRSGRVLTVLSGHDGELNSAAFDSGGERIVTAGADGQVIVWTAATGRELLRSSLHIGEAFSAVFSPDGGRVATAGSTGSVLILNAGTGQVIKALAGHENGTQLASFSPDGRRLLTVGTLGAVNIWSLR